MAKIELKRFSKVSGIWRIQARHLVKFFDLFKDDLLARNCRLPSAEPGSESYYHCLAQLFCRPETLPDALVEAVLAMEEQVANWPRLEAAVYGARLANLWLDTTCSPESLALQLWRCCPYQLGSNLSEVELRIENGKRVKEEERRAEIEYQARADALEAENQKKLEEQLKVEREKRAQATTEGSGAEGSTPHPLLRSEASEGQAGPGGEGEEKEKARKRG